MKSIISACSPGISWRQGLSWVTIQNFKCMENLVRVGSDIGDLDGLPFEIFFLHLPPSNQKVQMLYFQLPNARHPNTCCGSVFGPLKYA